MGYTILWALGTYVASTWDLPGTYLGPWDLPGPLGSTWHLPGTYLAPWDLPGTYLACTWHIHGIYPVHTWHRRIYLATSCDHWLCCRCFIPTEQHLAWSLPCRVVITGHAADTTALNILDWQGGVCAGPKHRQLHLCGVLVDLAFSLLKCPPRSSV